MKKQILTGISALVIAAYASGCGSFPRTTESATRASTGVGVGVGYGHVDETEKRYDNLGSFLIELSKSVYGSVKYFK